MTGRRMTTQRSRAMVVVMMMVVAMGCKGQSMPKRVRERMKEVLEEEIKSIGSSAPRFDGGRNVVKNVRKMELRDGYKLSFKLILVSHRQGSAYVDGKDAGEAFRHMFDQFVERCGPKSDGVPNFPISDAPKYVKHKAAQQQQSTKKSKLYVPPPLREEQKSLNLQHKSSSTEPEQNIPSSIESEQNIPSSNQSEQQAQLMKPKTMKMYVPPALRKREQQQQLKKEQDTTDFIVSLSYTVFPPHKA